MPDRPNDPTVGYDPLDGVTRSVSPETSGESDRTERIEPGAFPEIAGYTFESELGRGGMGVVYKARQHALNRTVALKMVLSGVHARAEELIRFLAEAETAAHLQHQGIVQIFESGRVGGLPYFTMEYVDGGSLADHLLLGLMPPAEAACVALKLTEAVAHAQAAGVVHRDLKPSNILIASDGTPKITDFGLARRLEAGDGITHTGAILGTPSYMPPEQARGDLKAVGPAGDVYSLGAILYEMLTGRPPFRSDTPMGTLTLVLDAAPEKPRSLNANVPRDLETIALKCLEKDPGRRYPSADALADDLRRFLEGRAILARRVSAAEKLRRWAKRNPAVATLLALVFVSLATGTVVSTVLAVRAEENAEEARSAKKRAEENAEEAQSEKKRADDNANGLATKAREAENAREAETRARRDAQSAAAEARYRLTRLHVATGAQTQERGEPVAALHWYAKAWAEDRDPANEVGHRARLGAALAGVPSLVGVCFHPEGVDDVAIDPAGTRLVTCTADRDGRRGDSAYLWDFAASKLAVPPLKHGGPVRSIAFSPDGTLVLTASEDRTAVLWSVATGKPVRTLKHDAPVIDASFSADGELVATAAGKTVRLWAAATGEPTGVVIELPGEAAGGEFARSADRLLAFDQQGAARVYDPATGKSVGPAIKYVPPTATQVRFYKMRPALSPDGTVLLARLAESPANTVSAVEVATGKSRWQSPGSGFSLVWSSDGRRVVLASVSAQSVLDAETGRVVVRVALPRETPYAALLPDGQTLAAGISGGGIFLWDVATGKPRGEPLQCVDFLRRLRTTADGRYLVAASQDGTARVWDLMTPAVAPTEYAGGCGRADLALYPDGMSLSPDGRTRFRPGAGGGTLERPSGPVTLPHPAPVTVSRFSSDGTRLATFAAGAVRVWDAATGKAVGPELSILAAQVRLDLSRDGRRVAAVIAVEAKREVAARVWEADSGQKLFDLPPMIDGGPQVFGPESANRVVKDALLTPDGRYLTVGVDSNGEMSVFEMDTGRLVSRAPVFRGWLYTMVPDLTGRTVLIASSDSLVRAIDAATGRTIGPPLRHPQLSRHVGVSPDCGRVVTVAADHRLRIWDLRTGDLLANLPLSTENGSCWFGADGTTVQYRSSGKYWTVSPPTYRGPADIVPRAVRVLTGRYLDETGGLADVGPDEFIRNRAAYRQAWLAWRGLPDDPAAQP